MDILKAGVIGNFTAILSQQPAEFTINADTLTVLIGLGAAIAVLLLIILIVCVTRFRQLSAKLEGRNPSPVDQAIAQITKQEDSYIEDSELVAVITAAIYASMGNDVPADGFVVRSIRRTNARRWMNA